MPLVEQQQSTLPEYISSHVFSGARVVHFNIKGKYFKTHYNKLN